MRPIASLASALALTFNVAWAAGDQPKAPTSPPASTDATGSTAGEGAAQARLASFFGATKGARTVWAADVKASLPEKKYFIVDVRPPADYAKGHVPGALSLPLETLFSPASLAKLPKPGGQPILLVCQTGHMASMALGGLAALGYEPWVLRFSMLAWDARTDLKVASAGETPQPVVGLGGPIEE